MKSIEDRLEDIKEDPVKFKRAFSAIYIISYVMLMLGALLIVGILAYTYLFQ